MATKRYSYKVLKSPNAGFQTDINILLKKFETCGSVRYEVFSKIWREMYFSCVYMLKEKRELHMFTNECFKLLASYLLNEKNFIFKTGILYLMYGMYVKQPSNPKVKIRLTLAHFKELKNILQRAITDSHYDVSYIFWSLYYENAFMIFSHPTMMGTISFDCIEYERSTGCAKATKETKSTIDSYVADENLELLAGIHKKYLSIKKSQHSQNINCLNIVDETLFQTVQQKLTDLKRKHKIDELDTPSNASECTESEYVEPRTVSIRKQQFGRAVQIPRSRRQQGLLEEDQTLLTSSNITTDQNANANKTISDLEKHLIEESYLEKRAIEDEFIIP